MLGTKAWPSTRRFREFVFRRARDFYFGKHETRFEKLMRIPSHTTRARREGCARCRLRCRACRPLVVAARRHAFLGLGHVIGRRESVPDSCPHLPVRNRGPQFPRKNTKRLRTARICSRPWTCGPRLSESLFPGEVYRKPETTRGRPDSR